MVLARSEYKKGNKDTAAAQLELAIRHASDDMIAHQARFRLVTIYIEQGKLELASALLDSKHDAAYDAQYAELRGDLLAARGETESARVEYDRAIELQGNAVSPWLQLKRDNLGVTGTAANVSEQEAS